MTRISWTQDIGHVFLPLALKILPTIKNHLSTTSTMKKTLLPLIFSCAALTSNAQYHLPQFGGGYGQLCSGIEFNGQSSLFGFSAANGELIARYDAYRIVGINDVPEGMSITTDVMSSADAHGPYGYWFSPLTGELRVDVDLAHLENLMDYTNSGGFEDMQEGIFDDGPGKWRFEVMLEHRLYEYEEVDNNLVVTVNPPEWQTFGYIFIDDNFEFVLEPVQVYARTWVYGRPMSYVQTPVSCEDASDGKLTIDVNTNPNIPDMPV